LSLDRGVQYHRNPLTAVRAYEEILHRLKDTAFPFALSNCTIFRILGGFAFASRSRNSRSPFPPPAPAFFSGCRGAPVFRFAAEPSAISVAAPMREFLDNRPNAVQVSARAMRSGRRYVSLPRRCAVTRRALPDDEGRCGSCTALNGRRD
jgi:hypothetical protein